MSNKAKHNQVIFPLRRIKTEIAEYVDRARDIHYPNEARLEEAIALIIDVIDDCIKERDDND